MILILDGPQVHDGVPSNTAILATARSKPTHVPDDWDNDDEDEEADSQKIWESAYAIPFQFVFLLPSRSRARRKLIKLCG